MATTIDTLQVEIQSNSTNAATGIRDLAKSLGELKSNGAIGVATKNLKNLSDTLAGFKDASNVTRSIGRLSGAMERLKNVGSISGVANSVKKLRDNLSSLENLSLDGVAPKIERMASVLAPLSNVKSGGINTMMNGLKKLGEVTKSLDDDTIAAFAARIEKLNTALTPLSQKMTTIRDGLREINPAIRKTTVSVEQANVEVNNTAFNLSNVITVFNEVSQVLQGVVQKLTQVMDTAIEWDGIAARFGRGFGASAQDTYDWIQRLNEEMGINVQQFMQYSSVYATMLTGFGVAMEDAGEMALGYTELTYDIWAGYNDIYAGFADAAEAVKSAIAGEVEPIRRAGFTIVEATLEQTAANHGLNISLANATEAQKSYLRYLTLVDQAHAQGLVGTYAKELSTAEGLMRTFTQQTKSLAQAFGSLFLPILVKIMPYMQAFVELLTEAVHWIAGIFGITIQGVDWSGYNEGVGSAVEGTDNLAGSMDSATKAAKELKNATLGMDELNVISPPSASGGSGGAGGGSGGTGFEDLDVDSLWDDSIFANIGNQVDKIKEKIKEWMPVIETIGAILAGFSIALLLANLGEGMEALKEMDGLAGGLKRTLAGLAILTIEAVLVFKLADEYLESGNLMNLIGEALATAAGGYLMYKGFGTTGLALSLIVSIAAQLAAITLNLADGGVEMDDPELWIQTAFTTATGAVGGGLIFWKEFGRLDAGKGAIFGALAALSLTLAAITIGNAADGDFGLTEGITTALSSILGGAAGASLFSFLGISTGGTGFLIGAGVMLAVNVIGSFVAAVSADAEKSLREDLKRRFGDVELSVSEIKMIIEKLTPEWADETKLAVDLRNDVEAKLESIDKQLGLMGAYEWQVSVGIGLTEEDMSVYAGAIDTFISDAQSYVNQRGYALEIGLKATTTTDSIFDSADAISVAASNELTELGKKLQDALNEAYEDGLLDVDELKVIQTIREDMLEIVNALSQGKIEAEFSMLEMKWSGVDLTEQSYKDMMAEWRDTVKNTVVPELEKTVKENLTNLEANVAFAEMKYTESPTEENKQLLDDAQAALQKYIDENPLENLTADVHLDVISFGLNTVADMYQAELKTVSDKMALDTRQIMNQAMQNVMDRGGEDPTVMLDSGEFVYGSMDALVTEMVGEMEYLSFSISKEARTGIVNMVKALKPTMDDLNEVAEASRKAGSTVAQNVRDGLNEYHEYLALAGDEDGIMYQIGKMFTTDAQYLRTLTLVEGAGSDLVGKLGEGFFNNLEYVKDEASGVVIGIKDTLTGEVVEITPTLVSNFANVGVNIGDSLGGQYQYIYDKTTGALSAITDSATGNSVWLSEEMKAKGTTLGTNLSDGVLTGAETGMQSDKKSWKDWAIWPWNWFKETNEINSPSKLFERGGKYLTDGLKNGMSLNSIKDKLSSIWSTAKKWWDNNKGTLKTYTPNIGSIYEKVKDRWDNARTWWNEKKSGMKQYTPSIGSIYEKVYDRWKNARDWWNNKKGSFKSYTPSIGSLTDKLKSAWSSAKTWWNKNVKLNTKLNVQVPTIKVKWDTASAFGKSFKYPTGFSLKFAADGGIFDQGSLIWAGERGPEVMATAAGGKTGVMNVQQMQDAVYEGVYAAVVAAMGATGGDNGSQAVNVYLDGRAITATVEKRQRERGASILGNQVYSY